jgi:hypothetical protein
MLARELSVDEIDRLTVPASVRQAQIDAERQVREAQVAADLKRDLVSRGMSIEEIQRLTTKVDMKAQGRDTANALARTIGEMALGAKKELDASVVARLLTQFLEKDGTNRVALLGPSAGARTVADAIVLMVGEDGNLDENAVARLLTLFLHKGAATSDPSMEAEPQEQSAQELKANGGAGHQEATEVHGIRATTDVPR